MPRIVATTVCFLCFQSVFMYTKLKTITRSGLTTRGELKVYIVTTNEAAESVRYHILSCTALRNSQTPRATKKVATFCSNAARESIICQGDMARIPALIRPYQSR